MCGFGFVQIITDKIGPTSNGKQKNVTNQHQYTGIYYTVNHQNKCHCNCCDTDEVTATLRTEDVGASDI